MTHFEEQDAIRDFFNQQPELELEMPPTNYQGFEIRPCMAFYKVYENGKLRWTHGTEQGAKDHIDNVLIERAMEDRGENIRNFRITH